MARLVLLLALSFTALSGFVKDPQPDWNRLIAALVAEDWGTAANLAPKYLRQYANELTETEKARLRYMHIYAVAGQLANHQLNNEVAMREVKPYLGQQIELPSHPLREEGLFDAWTLMEGSQDTLDACEASAGHSRIHCFVKAVVPRGFSVAENMNRLVVIMGKLHSIRIGGQMMPRFHLVISETNARIDTRNTAPPVNGGSPK